MYWCKDCDQPFEEFATDENGERCCRWCEGYSWRDVAAEVDAAMDGDL